MKSKRNFVNISMTNNSINRFTPPSSKILHSVIRNDLFRPSLFELMTNTWQWNDFGRKKRTLTVGCGSTHHALLTPSYIACDSLELTAVDIARILPAYGAEVNFESLPGNQESLFLVHPLLLPRLKIVIRSFLLDSFFLRVCVCV